MQHIRKTKCGYVVEYQNGLEILVKYDGEDITPSTDLSAAYNDYCTYSDYIWFTSQMEGPATKILRKAYADRGNKI